jgi:hypothetical protein
LDPPTSRNPATEAGVLDLYQRVLTGQALGDDEDVIRADEKKRSQRSGGYSSGWTRKSTAQLRHGYHHTRTSIWQY